MTIPQPIDPEAFADSIPRAPDGADFYDDPEPEGDGFDGPGFEPGGVDPADHYTPEEIAAAVAPVVGLGVTDKEQKAAMVGAMFERAQTPLNLTNAGEALAALGFHKGDGARSVDLPPGVALAIAGVGVAVAGLSVRGEYGYPVRVPDAVKRGAARAGWRAFLSKINPLSWWKRRRNGNGNSGRAGGAGAGDA